MNKKEKFESLFNGIPSDKSIFVPILMHFAVRDAGKTYREFASDHEVLADCTIKSLEKYDFDAVCVISDPYRETAAFGSKIIFPEDGVPQCKEKLIHSLDDITLLKSPDVYKSERTSDRIKAVKLLYKEVGSYVPVIGWVEGPLAESCDLAGVSEMLYKLMIEPEFVKPLIDKTLITAKEFAKAQIDAGCSIIGVGDAICSQIDSESYREFVKDSHHELISYIHQLGAKVKLHICGDITHLLEDIKDVKPDIIDIDSKVDMDTAYRLLGADIVRCGNLNPVEVIQNKTEDEILEIASNLCKAEHNRKFILSGGCEITVDTPPANLRSLKRAAEN
jgi:MtaA/CmuA family methyltransferase